MAEINVEAGDIFTDEDIKRVLKDDPDRDKFQLRDLTDKETRNIRANNEKIIKMGKDLFTTIKTYNGDDRDEFIKKLYTDNKEFIDRYPIVFRYMVDETKYHSEAFRKFLEQMQTRQKEIKNKQDREESFYKWQADYIMYLRQYTNKKKNYTEKEFQTIWKEAYDMIIQEDKDRKKEDIQKLVNVGEQIYKEAKKYNIKVDKEKLEAIHKEMFEKFKEFAQRYPIPFKKIALEHKYNSDAFRMFLENMEKRQGNNFKTKEERVDSFLKWQADYVKFYEMKNSKRHLGLKELNAIWENAYKGLVEEQKAFELEMNHKEKHKQEILNERRKDTLKAILAKLKSDETPEEEKQQLRLLVSQMISQ